MLQDVAAAKLLYQKGVVLLAAAPVSSLNTLLATPELQPLLGVTGGLSAQVLT
jgi:ABC-type phosphate/phosphonate transport system ATPase subunit